MIKPHEFKEGRSSWEMNLHRKSEFSWLTTKTVRHWGLKDQTRVFLTCVDSLTEASCRYSEFPQPNSWPSLDTARLQSPYELICCTSTPARSPPTSTGQELMLWWPKPGKKKHDEKTVRIFKTLAEMFLSWI